MSVILTKRRKLLEISLQDPKYQKESPLALDLAISEPIQWNKMTVLQKVSIFRNYKLFCDCNYITTATITINIFIKF